MCVCRTSVTPSGNTTRTCRARMNWLTLSFRVRRKGRNGPRKIVSSFGYSALRFQQAAGVAIEPRDCVLKTLCSDRHQSKTPFGSNEEHRKRGAQTCQHLYIGRIPAAQETAPHSGNKKGIAKQSRSQSLTVPVASCKLVIPPSSTIITDRRTCHYGSTSPAVTGHVFASYFGRGRRFHFAFSRQRPSVAMLAEMILDKALAACLA